MKPDWHAIAQFRIFNVGKIIHLPRSTRKGSLGSVLLAGMGAESAT
jgi:hypothetical protein